MHPNDTPKLCECGCGQPAPIAKYSNKKTGLIKGQSTRFIKGHHGQFPAGDGPNPGGLCMCGCGEMAPISPVSYAKAGYIRGKPVRFIPGHNGRRSASDRFWERVDRRGPDECWEWTGSRNPQGYGLFSVNSKPIAAHRFSYQHHYGPIPNEVKVLHRCDNPPCCNPKHLFDGSLGDNNRDRHAKGRDGSYDYYRGESHVAAKLSQTDVLEIRQLRREGTTQVELARRFNTSRRNIRSILDGRTWSHV